MVIAVVALLHDTVEDCDVTLQEIAELFGYQVASLVQELTSDKDEIARIGKTEYLKQKMLKMSSYGLAIKILANMNITETQMVGEVPNEKIFCKDKFHEESVDTLSKLKTF